jgi:hypothetical protein
VAEAPQLLGRSLRIRRTATRSCFSNKALPRSTYRRRLLARLRDQQARTGTCTGPRLLLDALKSGG